MTDQRWIPETLFDEQGFRMTYAVERVLYEMQTEHQHLVLFEHKLFGKMLMLDGATQVTTRDEFIYHEDDDPCADPWRMDAPAKS